MVDIVISEFMDEDAIDGLRARHEVVYDPTLVDDSGRLASLLGDARCLIVRNRTQVRDVILNAAPGLECVGRLGVGLDNIDVTACEARGVAVFPANGANDLSVAEYVITAALMLLRGAWLSTPAVIAGEWPRQQLIGRELAGRSMGLVGYGSIARQVARRAADLGMHCVAYDPFLAPDDVAWGTTRLVSLEALLAEADVVSLHTPLTEQTRHLIGAEAIARMKPGAVIINAALDVFEIEPLTAAAGAKFAGLPNLLLTPHIAGVTEESNVRVSSFIANRVLAHLENRQ
jgi:(S)-sulfolactate dehydrogenase